MFTGEDLKDLMDEVDSMEKTSGKARTLVREFRTALSQPAFANVESLGQLQRLIADGKADDYAIVRENKDTVLALIDKGREKSLSVSQFNDTLFHLYRLTEMQVMFVRGVREFFGSPVVTELGGMLENSSVTEMNDILTKDNDEAGG